MTESLRQARKALQQGHADAAVVLLWNEIEPARLRGDRRALATIEQLAAAIARAGDESERHEAEKLLESLRGRAHVEAAAPAATPVEGERATLDAAPAAPDTEATAAPQPEAELEAEPARRVSVGTIVWLLLVAAVVIANVLGQGRG